MTNCQLFSELLLTKSTILHSKISKNTVITKNTTNMNVSMVNLSHPGYFHLYVTNVPEF